MSKQLNLRIRAKNEATGMRVVGQYVQEFWECGWQPFDSRNDRGIDGLILMRKKNRDFGVKINVQVKCGSGYISSYNENEIRVSIHNQPQLRSHIDYWRKQHEPSILIFVNPDKAIRGSHGNHLKDEKGNYMWKESRVNAKAWWVDLKDEKLIPKDLKTIISIPKKNVFGEHSKGDFIKLIKPLLSNSFLPEIQVNKESRDLFLSEKLKVDARSFYKSWKNNNDVFCKAINKNIVVSRTGWRHILGPSRGKERRINSLRLLGVAKQIINEVDKIYLLRQLELLNEIQQHYGLRAKFSDKTQVEKYVQVILIRKLNVKTKKEKWWFYSVHYRR